jgi:hypothetical protein
MHLREPQRFGSGTPANKAPNRVSHIDVTEQSRKPVRDRSSRHQDFPE